MYNKFTYFSYVDFLHSFVVPYIPTVRSGGQPAIAMIQPKLNSSLPYEGPITYHLTGESGENFTDTVTTESDGSLKVIFIPSSSTESFSTSRNVPVNFTVWNHLSTYSIKQSVGVVGKYTMNNSNLRTSCT